MLWKVFDWRSSSSPPNTNLIVDLLEDVKARNKRLGVKKLYEGGG